MLRIGLLGGMSWESTAEYYRLANEIVRERLGGLHSAECVLFSVDFAEIEVLQTTGKWDEAGRALADAALALERAGAQLLLLCTNTMHKVADAVEGAISIPFLHVGDITAEAVRSAGMRTVGLLGTAFTMEQSFYRERLAGHGLDVVVPDADDRHTVHDIIYAELCRGIVTEPSRQTFREIIGRLVNAGAQGVVLGCTEIELLVRPQDADVPTFPTTRLHIAAAVERALTVR